MEYRTELPAVDPLWSLFLTTGWNERYRLRPDELYAAVERSWYSISTYDGARLVGFGRVMADGLHAMIYEVIVDPAFQRRGIGAQVLDRLVNRCLEANIRDIQLFCASGKQPFYEKHGFVARTEDTPGMDYRRKPE